MTKFYLLMMTFFLCLSANAQSKITIKGKLLDRETSTPIEEATVYFTRIKDSTVIDYTISDKNGFFKIEIKKITAPVFLKISAFGHQDHTMKENSLTESRDFGVLNLSKVSNVLSEVVVKNETPPVKIKKDTLEFNAASFKVRPDANVEALIRQLPGVEIDANKKITINGKEVNKILVNGKPFFGEDGKMALQNLPADVIKKVQVSDTKTKEEEITKQQSSSNSSTVNLTLQEDKNKGVFGKFMGGYGTDNRYESSGIFSYFTDKRRITAVVSSNNINSSGFSMDEVFDNMGGGRNGGKVMGSTSGIGITRSNQAGINYADQLMKWLNTNASYMFNNSDFENHNKTSEVTLLPTENIYTESEAVNTNKSNVHNAEVVFEYAVSPKTKIVYAPTLSKGNSESNYDSSSSSRDDSNQLMNESNSTNKTKSNKGDFQNNIMIGRTFEKKGRSFSATINTINSTEDSDALDNSTTLFYQGNSPDDIRNQNTLTKKAKEKYAAEIAYSEPISDSLAFFIRAPYKFEKESEDKNTFDFDSTNSSYSNRNQLLSSYLNSKINQANPFIGLTISKKKYYLRAHVGYYFIQTENKSLYIGSDTDLVKNYVLPETNIVANYNFSKSKSLFMGYNRALWIPTAYQLLPIANLSDPLKTYVGNPDLKLEKAHIGNFNFRNYNTSSTSGYSIFASASYYDSRIVSTSIYNANGKQTSSYTNVEGTYQTSLGANWNKSIKLELHNYSYSLGFKSGINLDKGNANTKLYSAKSLQFSPTVNFSYDCGEFFTIRPSYNFIYSDIKYTNYQIASTSNRVHNFSIESTNYWPKNWVFGNDFGYNYNSDISPGFKKDFYLWNTSLSHRWKNDQWIFKLKVYDILNQNQSATRTISATAVIDAENNVLKRYVMFSLTYKFQKFVEKEKNSIE